MENWELRIIDQILECDSLKIEALFFDSRRKDSNNKSIISKISIDEYEEENIVKVFPNFKEKLIATHNLDMNEDYFIMDGAFDLI